MGVWYWKKNVLVYHVVNYTKVIHSIAIRNHRGVENGNWLRGKNQPCSNPLEQQKLLLTWKYIWAEKEQFRLITDCDLYFPNFWSKFCQILINFEKLIVKICVIDFFLLICTTQLILECSEYQKNSSKKLYN